jgi:hypothetical protein
MKKYILSLITLVFISSTGLYAQNRTLKQVIVLQMPKTANDTLCGTRGASVCWNPVTKKYYAAFAGNTQFPMGVFTAGGVRVSGISLTTLEDIRGIWYDPVKKLLMANGYDDIGWISYTLDKTGIPIDYKTIFSGMNQPGVQSVGAYDARLKLIFFLDKSRVMLYENFADMLGRVEDSVQIHWGRKKAEGPGNYENEFDETEDYNMTNVVATGIPNAEFGFLNTTEKQIELYDFKEGYLQQTIKLPETAPVESMFNFSFTNGIYWLFDIENRKWIGYK